jgi:hypothetical protein
MTYRYSLLPTHSNPPDSPRKSPKNLPSTLLTNVFLSRRYARFWILALFFLACIAFVTPQDTKPWLANAKLWKQHLTTATNHPRYPVPIETPPDNDTRPPLFERYSAYEAGLEQHDELLPFPDDSSRKYLYFADHVWGLGWGNAMQEMILNAQLAYESGRTYVHRS